MTEKMLMYISLPFRVFRSWQLHVCISLPSLNFILWHRKHKCIVLCHLPTVMYERRQCLCIFLCHPATLIYGREIHMYSSMSSRNLNLWQITTHAYMSLPPVNFNLLQRTYICIFQCHLSTASYDWDNTYIVSLSSQL